MNDWQKIDKELQEAFEKEQVLNADRATLERWLVSLTGRSHQTELDNEKMFRRLDVVRHLVATRLTEEAEKRRDEQQARSAEKQNRHNRLTRWIAVAGIV